MAKPVGRINRSVSDSGSLNWVDQRECVLANLPNITKLFSDSEGPNWNDARQVFVNYAAIGPPTAPGNLRLID